MDFRLLGSLEVDQDGRAVALGPKQQSLLAILLVHRGEVVTADRLIDDIYGGQPPPSAIRSLHVHLSRLRKALGDRSVRTVQGGYVLDVERGSVDLDRLEDLAQQGRRALSGGDAATASSAFTEALGLWRGAPLADFRYADWAQPEIARLEEQRPAILEDRAEAELALGHHGELVGELDALVHEHPLRERLRGQLMLALYRSERQAEALDAYQDARRTLVEQLGIDPGRSLRELEKAILRQDPALDLTTEARAEYEAPPGDVPGAPEPPVEPVSREARKTVTVVSVTFTMTSSVGGVSVDPEALRRVTDRAFGDARASVDLHGGSVETITGGAMTAVFGLPAVHEDDALRAVRTTDLVREHLADLSRELESTGSMRLEFGIGVSTGAVVTGVETGAQPRVAGEPLQIAVRLAQVALPGDALLDEKTCRLVRDAVVVEDVPVGAMPSFRLLEVKPIAARPDGRLDSPMVGRERERRRLQDAFEQAVVDRSCQLFTVLGAAGVGKSRLVQEFLEHLDDDGATGAGQLPSLRRGDHVLAAARGRQGRGRAR